MAFETAPEVLAGLRRHFLSSDNYDEFGCYGEIFTSELTMPSTRRRADAVYMNLMESRGLSIDIVEIKVSHSDFKTELANPSKAEDFFHHSSRFWIAAPNEQVAPPEMIPEGWGLLLPPTRSNGKTWRTAVEPSVREPHIDMQFLRMITNRLRDVGMSSWHDDQKSHQKELNKVRNQAIKESRAEAALSPKQRKSLQLMDSLEASLGMKLVDWHRRDSPDADSPIGESDVTIRELVAAYRAIGNVPEHNQAVVRSAHRSAVNAAESLTEAAAEIAKLAETLNLKLN